MRSKEKRQLNLWVAQQDGEYHGLILDVDLDVPDRRGRAGRWLP